MQPGPDILGTSLHIGTILFLALVINVLGPHHIVLKATSNNLGGEVGGAGAEGRV